MITELEKMERAKMYIDKMAEGINPITNEYAPENDTINNVRISRCLFYVSEILEKVIANGGEVTQAVKSTGGSRNFFFITDEQLDRLSPRENSCYAKDIAEDIKTAVSRAIGRKVGIVAQKGEKVYSDEENYVKDFLGYAQSQGVVIKEQ